MLCREVEDWAGGRFKETLSSTLGDGTLGGDTIRGSDVGISDGAGDVGDVCDGVGHRVGVGASVEDMELRVISDEG